MCAATIRDVSARSGAEAELRSSERRFAQAFYASPAIMGITRLSDRTLVDVNDQWVRTMGVPREAAVGRTVSDLGVRLDPAWADEITCGGGPRRASAMSSSPPTPGGEIRGLKSASRIEVDGERCVRWSALDLTERLRAQEEARRQTAELERRVADRTAQLAVGQPRSWSRSPTRCPTTCGPLRAIDGFAQAVAEDYGDRLDDGGRRLPGPDPPGSQQMGELIDDLLALSRATRGE